MRSRTPYTAALTQQQPGRVCRAPALQPWRRGCQSAAPPPNPSAPPAVAPAAVGERAGPVGQRAGRVEGSKLGRGQGEWRAAGWAASRRVGDGRPVLLPRPPVPGWLTVTGTRFNLKHAPPSPPFAHPVALRRAVGGAASAAPPCQGPHRRCCACGLHRHPCHRAAGRPRGRPRQRVVPEEALQPGGTACWEGSAVGRGSAHQ